MDGWMDAGIINTRYQARVSGASLKDGGYVGSMPAGLCSLQLEKQPVYIRAAISSECGTWVRNCA